MRNNKGQFVKGQHYSLETEFKKGKHWRKTKPFWNKKWLKNEYINKNRSCFDIAKEHNVTDNAVWFWLNKHKIKARNISEARKIKYWGNSGVDNPMYNKKGELSSNWKGGVTKDRQLFYSSMEWKEVCRKVWKRDNALCQRCNIHKEQGIPFHIHHIISFKETRERSNINNLILLCEVCHRLVHSKKNINKEFLND